MDKELAAEEQPFWRMMVRAVLTCLIGAAISFMLHFLLEEKSRGGRALIGEIALHAGIAFIIALILTLALEAQARRIADQEMKGFLRRVSQDVLEAVFETIVPTEIMDEFKNIFRFEVKRTDCEYMVTFKKPAPGVEGFVVVRRELMFKVVNTLDRDVVYTIRSYHEADEEFPFGEGERFNHHLGLRVDGKTVDLVEGQNMFKGNGYARLEQPVTIKKGKDVEVYLDGEEPIALSARSSSYVLQTPVIGIRVVIINEFTDAIREPKVVMNHPQWQEMKKNYGEGRYDLARAFLPGQGFQVLWKI